MPKQDSKSEHCALRYPHMQMIDQREIQDLSVRYGTPLCRTYDVKAGGSILKYRWRKDSDRRAEVIFAIQGPGEQIWLHTKHQYAHPVFRLPTGGINWGESVHDALLREIAEEAGISVQIQQFVGVLEYKFHYQEQRARFASYLFLVKNLDGQLVVHDNDEVAEFRPILPRQLPQVAADLRNILGDRREWGHWRALSHDLLYEALFQKDTVGETSSP